VLTSYSLIGRSRNWPIVVLAAAVGILFAVTGIGIGVERGLVTWRNGLHPRAASGRVALVEIDARSLAAMNHWPWPRGLYGQAIAALNRVGARTIAFDVDFSSWSDRASDEALAHAIAASSATVVLPTFRQAASQTSSTAVENLPVASLRRDAMLAAVNIQADPDGLVRSYPYAVTTSGSPRPSIGALLADAPGRSGDSYAIDGAIDPDTVTRVSFVDLLRGAPRARALRGRNVLIGATAIELGDRYPVPGHGVMPGPLIQIVAAETLIQHSIPADHGPVAALVLMLVILRFALCRGTRPRGACFAAGLAMIFLLPLASEMLRLGTFDVVPALAALGIAWVFSALLRAVSAARRARYVDVESGLPNLHALNARLATGGADDIVVYRLAQASDLVAVLGHEGFGELIGRLAARLAPTSKEVFRVEESAIAWLLAGDDADAAIEGAVALLRAPFPAGDRAIDLEGGFGIADAAIGPDAVGPAAAAADAAIATGRRWCRHSEDARREQDWRLRIAGEIDAAMAAGDIWVAYQPKLDLATGTIRAAEALVRWRHPERGVIAPDDFIPVLEESGRIVDLTLHVVRQVLSDHRTWAGAGYRLGIAINLSARLPADADFVQRLEEILAGHAEALPYLTLEVTESATMTDPAAAEAALERLAALGIALSIDDYGSGLSTLSYLKRLPAREIKIDKSFVQGLESSRSDQAMVRSTIDLAHELGFKVVAEGVENASVLGLLRSYACDTVQGWHVGRPVPAAEFLQAAGSTFGDMMAA
jgi:EAL domain-containing protein (putative c-di-GMP-specific phosphodiesterase class I)/CHASE2 domain-containing sensor protein